jgi:hypothetical protein
MRMHPRRGGAYNFSARLASAMVNSHYKNKKRKQIHIQNNVGCLTLFVIIIFVILFIFNIT